MAVQGPRWLLVAVLAVLLAAAWQLRGPDIPYAALEAQLRTPGLGLRGAAGWRPPALPGGRRPDATRRSCCCTATATAFTSWDGWTRALGADATGCYSLDLPGHGLTRAPEGYRAVRRRPRRGRRRPSRRALALPRFALAGNSMGGGVAWHYALRHPRAAVGADPRRRRRLATATAEGPAARVSDPASTAPAAGSSRTSTTGR